MTRYFGTSGVHDYNSHRETTLGRWEFFATPQQAESPASGEGFFISSAISLAARPADRTLLKLNIDSSGDSHLLVPTIITDMRIHSDVVHFTEADTGKSQFNWRVAFTTTGEWLHTKTSNTLFLRAIIAEPYRPGEPNAAALIYADVCDETGRSDEAKLWRNPRSHPRSAAMRELLFGKQTRNGSGCWITDQRFKANALSPVLVEGWIERLTKATGVLFTAKPADQFSGDSVLSPAPNTYLLMGSFAKSDWII